MIKKRLVVIVVLLIVGSKSIFAQIDSNPPAPTQRFSEIVSKNFEQLQKTEVSRERRGQAYVKLLEGQRYVWSMSRLRTQTAFIANSKLAREALQKAAEFDPTLAETYTALAELTKNTPPYDIDEAIALANIAIKIDRDNFGAHQILAQLYTFNSRLNRENLDSIFTQKAIAEWKEIARLDLRNAEAYAFLSEFYAKTGKNSERINALKKWLASTPPQGSGLYGRIFQGANLSPETASTKLGEALLEEGQTLEAVEILSRAVADDPENSEAVELLRQAVESTDGNSPESAVQSLRQAAFANPENTSLIVLLAQIQARAGKLDDATKTLRGAAEKLSGDNRISAANLQAALADIYIRAERFDEALAVYEDALKLRGIDKNELVTDDERDFAIRVFDKMIDLYKKTNRLTEAKALIERARNLLGKSDLFSDKQLISFYRETGKKQEALQTVRSVRAQNTGDYSLLRLEASILTETGKVDEAVALIKTLIAKKNTGNANPVKAGVQGIITIPASNFDDFTNYLFISNLYNQAKRGKESIEAANLAFSVARSDDRKQIAKLTLATAQQTSGDYKSAEETLRALIKQSPGNPIALNNLGYFLVERSEKLTEALNLIQQALKIDSTNPSYLDSLGWAYFKLGNYAEAEKNLKNAARLAGSSATIEEHLGDVYQKQGKLELAKSAWQKALGLSSEIEESNRLKAKLQLKVAK